MSEVSPSVEKLEKELRVLRKKLERSEWHRSDLENQHDRDQHLYRRLHTDLEAAHRKAEIEAALERVRARAMAMRNPADLSGISEAVFTELYALGFADLRNTEVIINHDTKASITSYYYSEYGVTGVVDVAYDENPTLAAWAREMHSADDAFANVEIGPDEIEAWRAYRLSLGYEPDPRLDDATAVYYYSYSTGLGALSISSFEPVSAEQLDVLAQFRNVFSLAYQRYVDIARAEAQAREAQIEAALERVRARSMAMQSSEELGELSFELVKQVQSLGIDTWHCAFNIYDDKNNDSVEWGSNAGGTYPIYRTPREGVFLKYYEIGQTGESLHVEEIGEDRCAEHYAYLCTLPSVGEQLVKLRESGVAFPTSQIDHVAYFKYGYLLFITYEPVPEAHDVFKRFAKVFEQSYTRFLDLKRAEEQSREAQIEVALERVRARAMAMHASEELLEVIFTIHREYAGLGFPCGAFWQTRYTDDSYHKALTGIDGKKLAAIMELPRDFASNPALAAWERGDDKIGVFKFDADAACEYHHHMVTKGRFFEVDPEAITQEMIRENHGWTFVQARTSHGEIGYSLWGETEPSEEAKDVLVRFARTFDLAYRRFEDLQTAEAQTREVEVELALERVRAKTMAMQKSSDIGEVAHILYQQLENLGGNLWGTGFAFCTEGSDSDEFWFVNQGGILPTVSIPNTEDAVHRCMYEGWRNDLEIYTDEKGGEELEAHYEYLLTVPDVKGFFQGILDSGISFPAWQKWHAAYFSHGYLLVITVEPYEDERIFVRFAKVFEQAYTRFRDLQIAEAQAREAQVQLALERIRMQSMRMQHSSELVTTSTVFHEQLLALGVASEFSYVWLPDEAAGMHQFWATWAEETPGEDGSAVCRSNAVTYDLDKAEPYTAACFAAWESDDPICVAFIPPADVDGFFTAWPELLEGAGHMRPEFFADGLFYAEAYMRFGCFGINIRHEPTGAECDIVRRFANEFEQAYTRFLDLQRAEEQARTATRQAALDRVRAEIASMRTAADLERITPLIWRELTTLGVPFFRCGVFIMDESAEEIETYLTTPDGDSLAAIRLPYDIAPTTEGVVASWREHDVFTAEWDREQFVDWVQTIADHGVLSDSESYTGGHEPPESLALHFVPFEQGMLYVGSAGPLDETSLDSARLLADAFAVAYARYEDFQRLEAKNREVEAAMADLRAAQAQLVQSEKMASLGQLTAGIAHEIKNPLNFINNFAGLLQELVDDFDEAPDDAERRAILEDVKINAATIEEHGRRADEIVRAMMEHARSGSGERRVVELNTLVEEYAGLAYHGMRARHPESKARMTRDLAADAGEVELVPQEIGRVLINLLDNAFDAVRGHAANQDEGYAPTVHVSTERRNGQVFVCIEDNGPGMSEEVRSKVFEPFYTTKPTGQGTGLGLSLSHDIVSQGHGGKLEVESVDGRGAKFTVTIPVPAAR